MLDKDFDITKQIRMTEQLQCQLLSELSTLFCHVQQNAEKAVLAADLADLENSVSLLAARFGISKYALDQKAISQLKLALLKEEDAAKKGALLELLHAMEK